MRMLYGFGSDTLSIDALNSIIVDLSAQVKIAEAEQRSMFQGKTPENAAPAMKASTFFPAAEARYNELRAKIAEWKGHIADAQAALADAKEHPGTYYQIPNWGVSEEAKEIQRRGPPPSYPDTTAEKPSMALPLLVAAAAFFVIKG